MILRLPIMEKRDYYEVLGVHKNDDEATIKKAYRNLAMKFHPDKNPGDTKAMEKMKEINEAYAVLSNTHKRKLYDTYGHSGLEGYTQEDIFRGVDFASLFSEFGLKDFFSFGNSIFDTFFGRRTSARTEVKRGVDLRYDLSVSLEEVAFGAEKTLELPKTEQCSLCDGSGAEVDGFKQCDRCNGTGQIVNEQRSDYSIFRQIFTCNKCHGKGKIVEKPCKQCQGKGVIETIKKIVINIPTGADTGFEIKVEGEGEKGEGVPGDLYIILNVRQHPVFERHGDDIYTQQDVTFTTAALGGKINVPGLEGDLNLDIPEGTQTGTSLRVVNKGVPHINGPGKGDEYIIIRLVTPTNLSKKEKEILREFKRLRDEDDGN
jgi:molecular chaperone DnaJ